jgi:TetR/AcrR family transcriptional repressor of nem operon
LAGGHLTPLESGTMRGLQSTRLKKADFGAKVHFEGSPLLTRSAVGDNGYLICSMDRVEIISGRPKCTVKYMPDTLNTMPLLESVGTLPAPSTPKGRATRARIVDAAAALVLELGVAGTSLDEVGVLAHAGKSQIYHYFDDKADLIGAVVTRQTMTVLDGQEPFISRLDSWESWKGWRDELVRQQSEHGCVGGCPLGSIANELADANEACRSLLVGSFDQWRKLFQDGISRMQTNGLVRTDTDSKALAFAILAGVQGGLLLAKTYKSTAPLVASLDASLGYLRSFEATATVMPE